MKHIISSELSKIKFWFKRRTFFKVSQLILSQCNQPIPAVNNIKLSRNFEKNRSAPKCYVKQNYTLKQLLD